jgi:hypothetical protein
MSKSTQGLNKDAPGGDNTFPTGNFAAAQVVKNAPGVLCAVLVTVATTAVTTIYDNASAGSGTVIGVIPSAATAGQIFVFNMPANLGITIGALANAGSLTISYF